MMKPGEIPGKSQVDALRWFNPTRPPACRQFASASRETAIAMTGPCRESVVSRRQLEDLGAARKSSGAA